MSEKPIIFSGEMVRAILDGRKTQTRRVIKPQPELVDVEPRYQKYTWALWSDSVPQYRNGKIVHCPYGQPDGLLWVRETARGQCYGGKRNKLPDWIEITYRADESRGHFVRSGFGPYRLTGRWTPSIFMPRWASRITLQVLDVRVERINDISIKDVYSEGLPKGIHPTECQFIWFRELWDSLNAKRGFPWSSDPWVWVIEFEVVVAGGGR